MTDRRRHRHPAPPGLADASALSCRPRVVVVGAGIAGLAAAAGLAERGVAVEVVEKQNYLGGRVGGWIERDDDVELAMNRGFHAFFRQYYNLRDLLRRVDPQLQMLTPVTDYPLIDGAGRRDSFRGLPRTPPWNALAFALRSPTFRPADLVRIDAPAAAPLAAVSVPDIYHQLDHIDAETFLKSINFPESARHLAFEVFSRSFFAEPSQLSAGELATMFHIYFLGSNEGLIFDVANTNFDVGLWNPLRDYLKERGVRFRLGTQVQRVDKDGAKGFRVQIDSGDPLDTDAVVLAAEVGGLQQIVAESPDLGNDLWRGQIRRLRSAPSFLVHRLWLDRAVMQTGPLSSERRVIRHWTTSACWIATKVKPPRGPAATAAPLSNYIPMQWMPMHQRRTGSSSCTSCIPKPQRRMWFTNVYCAEVTAHCSLREPTPGARRSRRRNPAWPWPATASVSICRWR